MNLTRRRLAAMAGTLPFVSQARAAERVAVLGIDADPPGLNPALSTDYAAGDIGAKIFEGLVWIDRNWSPQPSLATAWTETEIPPGWPLRQDGRRRPPPWSRLRAGEACRDAHAHARKEAQAGTGG